jgi:hypothetical protein
MILSECHIGTKRNRRTKAARRSGLSPYISMWCGRRDFAMTWLYVPNLTTPSPSAPEPEGSNSASSLPDPERAASLTWRGKHMQPEHWSRAWKRDSWLRRLSGLTLPPSTLDHGVAAFIASLPEIHARRTASPAGLGAAGDASSPRGHRIADECGPDRIFRENVTGECGRTA